MGEQDKSELDRVIAGLKEARKHGIGGEITQVKPKTYSAENTTVRINGKEVRHLEGEAVERFDKDGHLSEFTIVGLSVPVTHGERVKWVKIHLKEGITPARAREIAAEFVRVADELEDSDSKE